MARSPRPIARLQPLSAFGALAVLAAATAAAFGRVFVGGSSTVKILAAAVASAAVASVLARRSLMVATVVSAALMVVAVGLLVLPWTTWHGVPTLATLRVIRDSAGLIGQQARVQIAPTPPLPPLMLAAVTAMWAAVFVAHTLAFRAGRPLLSLVPPVALVAFADTVLQERFRPGYGVLFLFGALAVVFVDGLDRVRRWGPLWAFGSRRHPISPATLGLAGKVFVGVIAVAGLAPLFVPGIGSKPLIDLSDTPGGDVIRIDPQVAIASKLTSIHPQTLFTVKTTTPTYYRMLGLDRFDGNAWTVDMDGGNDAVQGGPLAATPSGASLLHQDFDVATDLVLPGVPAAYAPVSVLMPTGDLTYDDAVQNVYADGALEAGTRFSVTSALVRPTPVELNAVHLAIGQSEIRWIRLPLSLPDRIRTLALDWTERSPTMYQKVLAIQTHLSPAFGFKYDESVNHNDDQYTLLDFLTTSKRGFCQQFASAMAVLLRSIGIPARVAVGFTQGTYDSTTDVTKISSSDAHSWVEVWFGDRFGWLAFEPTPRRTNPVAVAYYDPARVACALSGGKCASPDASHAVGSDINRRQPRSSGPAAFIQLREHGFAGPIAANPTERHGVRLQTLVLEALGLIVLGGLLAPPVRALRRRVRLRMAAGDPRRMVIATYEVFTDRAGEIGFGRRSGETLEEYRRRVVGEGLGATGDLDRLTLLTQRAAYAQADPSAGDPKDASRAARGAIRELRKSAGPVRRLVGAWRPDR